MTFNPRREILALLRGRYLTTPALSAPNTWITVFANKQQNTKPAVDVLYVEETPGEFSSSDASIGQAVRYRQIVGSWQLMLCVTVNSDIYPALDLADSIEATMLAMPALTLTDGSILRISRVSAKQPREARLDRIGSDARPRVPVVIMFTVLTHT